MRDRLRARPARSARAAPMPAYAGPAAAGSGRIATPSPRAASCASTPGSEASNAIRAGTPVASQMARTPVPRGRQISAYVSQVLRAQRGPARQRVIGAHGGHDRRVDDQVRLDPGGRLGAERRHRQIERSVAHAGEQRVRRVLGERDLDVRVRGVKRRQHVAERHRGPGRDHPHAHVPADQAAQLVDGLPHALGRRQRRSCIRKHGQPRLGRRHRARAALEELDAQFVLEPSHLCAHARLRHQHAHARRA